MLIKEIRGGTFRPVYLLMGEEAYYPDLVCKEVLDNCIDEFSKDFNETVCYGLDVTADQIVTAARRFPMMADRQLVVVREAQLLKDIEQLSIYCEDPMDSTVLVILYHGGHVDRRRALFKAVQKNGVVLDSPVMKDRDVPRWIEDHFRSRKLRIEPAAASLLAEHAGTDLSKLVLETDKLLKNLPEGSTCVTVDDIEKNVGISRQFSIFELTRALSYRDSRKAMYIAAHLGAMASFSMPPTMGALYLHFSRILKYGALLSRGAAPSPEQKSHALQGVADYYYKEYDAAVRNYPLPKAMKVMSLLCEYDYLGKGGDGGKTDDGELIVELTAKILNL